MRHRQDCTECNRPSLPGLMWGKGKCNWHWTAAIWGADYATAILGRLEAVSHAES